MAWTFPKNGNGDKYTELINIKKFIIIREAAPYFTTTTGLEMSQKYKQEPSGEFQ